MSPDFIAEFYRGVHWDNVETMRRFLLEHYKPKLPKNKFTITSPKFSTNPMIHASNSGNLEMVKYIWEELTNGVIGRDHVGVEIIHDSDAVCRFFTADIKTSCLVLAITKKHLELCQYLYSIGPQLSPTSFFDGNYSTYSNFVKEWERGLYINMLICRNRGIFERLPEIFAIFIKVNLFSVFIATHNNNIEQQTSKRKTFHQATTMEMFQWLLSIAPSEINIPELFRSEVGAFALRRFMFTEDYPLASKCIELGASFQDALGKFPNRNTAIKYAICCLYNGGSLNELKQTLVILGLDTPDKIVKQLGSSPLSKLMKYQRLDLMIYYRSIGVNFEYDARLYNHNKDLMADYKEFEQFYNQNWEQFDIENSIDFTIRPYANLEDFLAFSNKNSNPDLLAWIIQTYPKYLPIILSSKAGRFDNTSLNSGSLFGQAIKNGCLEIAKLLSKHIRLSEAELLELPLHLKFPYWDTSPGYLNPIPSQNDKEFLQTFDWLLTEYPSLLERRSLSETRFLPLILYVVRASSIGGVYVFLRHSNLIGTPLLREVERKNPYGDTPLMMAAAGNFAGRSYTDGVGGQIVQVFCDRAIEVIMKCGDNLDRFDDMVGNPVERVWKRGGTAVMDNSQNGSNAQIKKLINNAESSATKTKLPSRKGKPDQINVLGEVVEKVKGTKQKKGDNVQEEKNAKTSEQNDSNEKNEKQTVKKSIDPTSTQTTRTMRKKASNNAQSDSDVEKVVEKTRGRRAARSMTKDALVGVENVVADIKTEKVVLDNGKRNESNGENIEEVLTTRSRTRLQNKATCDNTHDGDDPVANSGRQRSRKYK